MNVIICCALFAVVAVVATPANAEIKVETVTYNQGDTTLEGLLAYDTAKKGKQPAVVVIHDWMGVGDYAKKRIAMLAELGYVAFAADIYGKGVRPKDSNEASQQAGKYRADRALMRARVNAAVDWLKKNAHADPARVAAMGYCFGGGVALELARSGADVRGVVSFHGSLDTPNPADAKNIKGKVLVLHGADDPFVNAEAVAAFEKEMRDAKVNWELVKYSGAVHSFTSWDAGNDNSKGAAYNEQADKRSWEAMRDFFAEVLK